MKVFKNLSFLNSRYKAEQATAGLPGLIASAEKAVTSILVGEHTQRKSGTGEKFWQFREYNSSDRPQDIDWRQSAKGDRLFVREKEWQTTQSAYLWCQHNDAMDYRSKDNLPTKQDTAMVLALAMGILLSRAGEQIAPLEASSAPGRSELAVQSLGERLLKNQSYDLPGHALRKIPVNCSLVLVGDFLSPFAECKKVFDLLAEPAENVIIMQVLDPAELTLPFEGRIIFERKGHDDRYHVDNVETIRTAYQQRMAGHMEELKKYCKQHRWHWLLHTTDENVRDTLLDAWMMMTPESYHTGNGGAQ